VLIFPVRVFISPNYAIITDPYRLKQILRNLINNAIKFTDTGQVEYGYRLTRNDLVFFVSDTGIGLSEENRKLVFDRFKQVDDGSNRKYGGTGLGLAICKNLVELLGGKIWLLKINKPG
jgi:signal transduction histidine kinase